MSYDKHGLSDWTANQFVERFPMGAPYSGGKIHGPPINDLNEKVDSVRKNCDVMFFVSDNFYYIFYVVVT